MHDALFADLKTQGKLPNFVVVGAPRSGTTALYYYLRQHPQVYLPNRKELHYFSYPQLKQERGGPGDRFIISTLCKESEEYARHYQGVKNESAIGEISPSYLYFSKVADRMRKELGSIKIIITLRNPIEKAFSQFMHMVGEGRETLSFEKALSEEKKRMEKRWADIWRYAESSLYSSRLEKYLTVFGKKNVKVILFENLKRKPQYVLRDIFQFLNINDSFVCDTSGVFSRSGSPRSKRVAKVISSSNPLYPLVRAAIPSFIGIPFKRLLARMNRGGKPTLNQADRDRLQAFFAQDIYRLESLLGKRLNWIE